MSSENKLVSSIYKDCSTLIESFVSKKNAEFKSFCEEYNRLKFHNIYKFHIAETDMILTTRHVFAFCRGIFKKTKITTTTEKIASIYLMYCIYHKQLQKHYVKIQVDMETYQNMRQFVEVVDKKQRISQARYIFYHLVSVNAFRFVFSEIYYGLERLFNKSKDYTNVNVAAERNETEKFLNPEISNLRRNTGLLEAIKRLEINYNVIKEKINDKEPVQSKQIAMTDIIKEYKTKISDIAKLLKIENEGVEESTSKETNKRMKAESSEILSRRADIKKRAAKGRIKIIGKSVFDKHEEFSSESDEDTETSQENAKFTIVSKKRKVIKQELDEELDEILLE